MRRLAACLFLLASIGVLALAGPVGAARAETATIAVSLEFARTAERLATDFHAATGHEVRLSVGPTVTLYGQIAKGAPFDVLLAADDLTPARLVFEDLAEAGTQVTYAIGSLVLWHPRVGEHPETLAAALRVTGRLAVADPETMRYGLAARQAMEVAGLWGQMLTTHRLNIVKDTSEVHRLVSTGGADAGMVSRSQVQGQRGVLIIDPDSYDPIRQDAVLIKRAMGNRAARDWIAYLTTPRAQRIITAAGYRLP